MEIKLTETESQDFFYNALCNGLGSVCSNYSLELTFEDDEYQMAKSSLTFSDVRPCYEDVLMALLKMGYKITLKDIGYEGEHDSTIGLEEVRSRVQTVPVRHLIDMINGNDDGDTADTIIQHVFYGKDIFG